MKKTAMAALALFLAHHNTAAQDSANFRDPSPHQAHFIEVEKNVKIEALDWGGTGPPLVLLAGSGNSAHLFDEFAARRISARMRAGVPEARIVELPGANRYLFLSNTAEALAEIRGFIQAQLVSKPVAFEVASVKASREQLGKDAGSRVAIGAAGVTAKNVTLKQLISSAYGLQPEQIGGGPRWLDEAEYDLEAKASRPSPATLLQGMLQALLAERFQLKTHRESRPMRVYVLAQDKGGARIRPVKDGDGPARAEFRGDLRQFASLISLRLTIPAATDPSQPSIAGGPQVPVLDETGLDGVFEIDLNIRPELGVDSFTLWQRALREQLGLRLESRMEPVELLVIERAEKAQAD